VRTKLHNDGVQFTASSKKDIAALNDWFNSIGRALRGEQWFGVSLSFKAEIVLIKQERGQFSISVHFAPKDE
jgi:hypothetical protein